MRNEKNDSLWQELTLAEATECVGGIVTTGPVRLLNMAAIIGTGPVMGDGFAAIPASGPLG